ncbi:CoA transferase [Desulfosarcina alkanivorans]|uniref:CoA transferase n=1 Tax=Desulfosarcina alkanivorans TaxID=571177 RepID=UPI0022B0F7C1|nr:CoA transferase [Desulfosarcina alkanivorans]
MILSDHGARVISIEDRRYKNDGLYIKPLYRNKQHITLSLKTGMGKEIFFKLAEKADVIIETFRPGVARPENWESATMPCADSIRKLSTAPLPDTARPVAKRILPVMM